MVLQSEAMTTKDESYFHKEIRLALERQNYFRPGIRFIIPTCVHDKKFTPLLFPPQAGGIKAMFLFVVSPRLRGEQGGGRHFLSCTELVCL